MIVLVVENWVILFWLKWLFMLRVNLNGSRRLQLTFAPSRVSVTNLLTIRKIKIKCILVNFSRFLYLCHCMDTCVFFQHSIDFFIDFWIFKLTIQDKQTESTEYRVTKLLHRVAEKKKPFFFLLILIKKCNFLKPHNNYQWYHLTFFRYE